ncbi:hypothetical protein CEXT_515971 [Caerostris extrusa]|uniref:Cytochrome P450 n=1 Tax=Caerostris extrusa TaxID=172846 RepID=A0AAV4V9U7_CAEEX|nr:hypothetical protein CEXT_515971 [Caerostris extrusa]
MSREQRPTVVCVSFLVHRDEASRFPDPEKFDPERFLPESTSTAHIRSVRVDSFCLQGPRNCIAQDAVFAEMEVKILVCHILRNFSLHSLDSGTQVLPIPKITSNRLNPPCIRVSGADNSERFLNCPCKN